MALLKKAVNILVLFLITEAASAQVNRYMVFFTDKANSEYSVSRPSEFLATRSRTRRQIFGIDVTESDLPVNSSYVNEVKALGAETFFRTKWLNGVLVEMDESLIAPVESLTFVDRVEEVAPGAQLLDEELPPNQGGLIQTTNPNDFSFEFQNELVGIPYMHDNNTKGNGVMVGVLDNGFPNLERIDAFAHLITNDRIVMTKDFANNQISVDRGEGHGLRILSIMAAEHELFQGGIPEADYALFITEDPIGEVEYRIEEYNWLFAAEAADSAGVDIITSSVGYSVFSDPAQSYDYEDMDGNTAIISIAAGLAESKGITVITSAGNEGNRAWQFITAPADHPAVIAVGAVNVARRRSSISSIGPNSVGNTKPDVAAFGNGVTAIDKNGELVLKSGTSLSAPFIAALAAGLLEARVETNPEEMRKVIKAAGHLANQPNNELGYGIPTFEAAVDALRTLIAGNQMDVQVFPNPSTTDYTFVKFPEELLNQEYEFKVVSTNGHVAIQGNITPNEIRDFLEIRWGGSAPGIYLLTLIGGSRKITQKLIKY